MKKKFRYEIDVGNLSPLIDKRRVEIDELAAMPDSVIDHSDIPT
ncbi:hypothetical protein GGR08_001563 [Bartonella fuyuanensis]|uniref:Uncharacterized protein n=1 Tax=Bartonella fuyuanensis TaxID=1460968 RepID=A0A840E0H7_9HYPH|nr:hypothetical protein [Bartonella fuyuanensis]MBB4077235.1 hypothetical protein [Bartonella fuyuanensis]